MGDIRAVALLVYIWENQWYTKYNPQWIKITVQNKLKELFISKWNDDLSNSSHYILYKQIKVNFGQEKYFENLNSNLITKLCRFRLSNFKLPIVKGRYTNVPRYERKCDHCTQNNICDEYHFILECNNPMNE